MSHTNEQYDAVINLCKDTFTKKMQDYGSAWRILRTSSLTDQIYIKAKRIRSIEEKGHSKVEEGIFPELIGIANYAVMALIQLEKGVGEEGKGEDKGLIALYDHYFNTAKDLMSNKNHDYDEAWRDMRITSLTDLILMKLLRVKQIENNDGNTLISEGLDANYLDIINYAVFAMIRMEELKKATI